MTLKRIHKKEIPVPTNVLGNIFLSIVHLWKTLLEDPDIFVHKRKLSSFWYVFGFNFVFSRHGT